MKSRFLTASEKRDVANAAAAALRLENPDCHIHVEVEDWTNPLGVPVWTATVRPRSDDPKSGPA
jgi:hypothetical protein